MLINCKTLTHLVSESHDRKLTTQEKIEVTLHTSWCSGCRQFKRQMKDIHQMMRLYNKR